MKPPLPSQPPPKPLRSAGREDTARPMTIGTKEADGQQTRGEEEAEASTDMTEAFIDLSTYDWLAFPHWAKVYVVFGDFVCEYAHDAFIFVTRPTHLRQSNRTHYL